MYMDFDVGYGCFSMFVAEYGSLFNPSLQETNLQGTFNPEDEFRISVSAYINQLVTSVLVISLIY